jgi:hypothetical protein
LVCYQFATKALVRCVTEFRKMSCFFLELIRALYGIVGLRPIEKLV